MSSKRCRCDDPQCSQHGCMLHDGLTAQARNNEDQVHEAPPVAVVEDEQPFVPQTQYFQEPRVTLRLPPGRSHIFIHIPSDAPAPVMYMYVDPDAIVHDFMLPHPYAVYDAFVVAVSGEPTHWITWGQEPVVHSYSYRPSVPEETINPKVIVIIGTRVPQD